MTDLIIEESDYVGTYYDYRSNDLRCHDSAFFKCPIKNLYLGRSCYRVVSGVSSSWPMFDLFSDLSTLKSVTIGKMDYLELELTNHPLENFTIVDKEKPLQTGYYWNGSKYKIRDIFGDIYVENMYIGRDYVCSWKNGYGDKFSYTNYKIADHVKHFTLGGNCTFVGESQFSDIKELTSITIGDNVTEIKKLAFYGCSGLTSIYSTNLTPCELNETAFENMHYLTSTLYVPIGALEAYQNAEGWKNFFNIREFDPTGIEGVKTDTLPTAIYTLSGKKVSESQNGQIYIFRYGNGKTVKKLVK